MREITSPSGGSLGAPGILDQGFVIRDLSEEPAEVGDTPPPVDSREPTAEEPSLEDLVHGDLEREEPARAEFRVPHEGDGDGEPPLDDEDKEAVLSLFELPADEESSSGGGQAIDGQDSRGAASNEVMGGGLSCSLHTPSQGEALDILFLFLVALVVIPSLKGSKLRLG